MLSRSLLTCAALALALGQCGTAMAALTGEYLFEEGSGTSAVNSGNLGAAANGTLMGVTGLPTYTGVGLYTGSTDALLFNSTGVDQADQTLGHRVVLPNDLAFIRNAPGATLMAWVRMDGNTANNRTIIGINNGDATAGSGDGAARATLQVINSGGSSQLRAIGRKDDTGGSSSANSGTNFLTVGQVYHLTGVFDYLNGGVQVYIDGQLAGSAVVGAWNTNSADSNNLRAVIGSVASPSASNQERWPGIIDGARIYDHALTGPEILAIYNAEVIPEPTSMALLVIGCAATALRRRRA